MEVSDLKPGALISGPLVPETVEVLAVIDLGSSRKVIGRGIRSGMAREIILPESQIGHLAAAPSQEPLDGDPQRFRLRVEAHRLGLAYEYDPYFSLSIARVDPLPHQTDTASEQAQRVLDETRSALRELGLNEDAHPS